MNKIVLSLLVILSLTACDNNQEQSPQNEKPTIKIGAILPLTGNTSTWGQAYNSGILLAYKNANPLKYNYKLIIEDYADNLKNLPAITSKLINMNKADAVITLFDPTANIVSPILTKNNKIHFGASWFPKFIGNRYNFNFYASIEDESDKLVKRVNKSGLKKIALFTVNQTGFIDGTKILKKKLNERGVNICEEIKFNFNQKNFKMEILKVFRDCKPDLFIIGAFPPESDILIKQIKEIAGREANITGLDLGLNVTSYGLYEGLWFPSPAIPDKKFISQYREQYHKDDYLFGAGIAYDQLNILIDAYENAKTNNSIPTTNEISGYIHQKKQFDSVFGNLKIEENGQVNIPVDLIKIKEGKPFVISEE